MQTVCLHPAWHVPLADGPPGALIALIVVAIVAFVIYGAYASKKRRQALAAWAASRGLMFRHTKVHNMDSSHPAFACLRQGRDRYAYNIIEGAWGGRAMTGFDYHYVTGSGKNRSSHYFSAVILNSAVPLKPLRIRPENFFDKVGEFFGADDIDFESAQFSRRFYVKSPDKRWAYDVIHARTMEFLLASPTFAMQFDTTCVICYRGGTFKPADFQAACEVAAGVLDLLPEYVIRQQHDLHGTGKGER